MREIKIKVTGEYIVRTNFSDEEFDQNFINGAFAMDCYDLTHKVFAARRKSWTVEHEVLNNNVEEW